MDGNNVEYEQKKAVVVKEFNEQMKKEGSNIGFVKGHNSFDSQMYTLTIIDKYIDNKFMGAVNLTDEAKIMIREYFESRGIKFQFSNTVNNIA